VAKEIAQALFENNREALYKAFGKALLDGNAYTFDVLAKRAFGNAPEKHEISGPDGGAIVTNLKLEFVTGTSGR
jgi:hypothetical protein